jgi:putative phage-type endonuclease
MTISGAQAKERIAYLGGSDIAAVLGLSRFKTPLQVWGEKTGNIVPDDISDKLQVKLGNKLEATVCELFTEQTGKKVARVNDTLTHPSYPFLCGNIDRRVVGERAILEAKTTSPWNAQRWEGDEVPQEYLIQTYYYMQLTGSERGYIACLIGNQDFVVKTLERDAQIQGDIIRKAAEFWTKYIEPKVMPSVITSRDADTLYDLFPLADGESVKLGDEANALVEAIKAMKQDAAALESSREKAENELRAMLKDSAEGVTDRYRITWKNQTSHRLDLKRLREAEPAICAKYAGKSDSRVLRIASLKPSK